MQERLCADGEVVEGIDVSKWQGDIDWDRVAGDGVAFAFIRVNHGLGDIDERFAENWREAARVGVLRGAYQYFLPNEDAVAQADLLLERMGVLETNDLPPVLDVEESAGESARVIRAKVRVWIDRVESATGRTPIIYTARYFWRDGVGAPDTFIKNPLWVANYNVGCPLMAEPWACWLFWQYSSSGGVAGIRGNVDLDQFNGTREQLLSFAGGQSEPPEQPEPPDPLDPDPIAPQSSGGVAGDPGQGGVPGDDMVGGCSAGGTDASSLALALLLALGVGRYRAR